jgi:PemK-like, MazF-like toxin of type II toxin-antitoxin system
MSYVEYIFTIRLRHSTFCLLSAYCPDAGNIIWLDFFQSGANEQARRRPALVLSPRVFNELTGRSCFEHHEVHYPCAT